MTLSLRCRQAREGYRLSGSTSVHLIGQRDNSIHRVKRVGLDIINLAAVFSSLLLSLAIPSIRRLFDLRSRSVIEISSDSEADAELNSDVFRIQSLTRMPPPKDFNLDSDLFGIQTRRTTSQRDFKHLFASLHLTWTWRSATRLLLRRIANLQHNSSATL